MTNLLDEAIDAHGGRRRWRKASEISAHLRTGGLLMASKLKRRGHFSDCGVSVAANRVHTVFRPYPRPGRTGVFDRGAVRILDDDGDTVAERTEPRPAFFGLSGLGRKLWWSDLDALYFGGYAIWNYLSTPWMLEGEGFSAEEGDPIQVGGEVLRRLEVRFPQGLPTHGREQSFFFDAQGLLRRHHYTAEVIGSFARACHTCSEHATVDGLVFPKRRRVSLRGPGDRALPGPKVVTIDLASISVA